MRDSFVRDSRPELCEALFEAPVPESSDAWNGRELQIAELAHPPAGPPVFRMEGTVAAPLALLAAMIRESDLGALAGSLKRWDVLESEASEPYGLRVFYVSTLPWPFRDRAFHIGSWVERPAAHRAAILSMSLEPDEKARAAVRGEVWGEVVFSGYFLVALAPELTWLRRVIGIELRLPLPRAVLRRMLVQVYRGNYAWMSQAARSPDLVRRFERRMASNPMYAALADSPR